MSAGAEILEIGQLRVLLAGRGDGVIVTDVDGRVIFMNPVAQALTGWQSERARGQPLAEVFSRAEDGALIAKGGARVLVDASTSPLDAGAGAAVVVVFREITRGERFLRAEHDAARLTDDRLTVRLAQLQALTAAFSKALTPIDVATVVLHQGCAAVHAPRGTVAVLDAQGDVLRMVQAIGFADHGPRPSTPMSQPHPFTDATRSGTPLFLETTALCVARYPAMAQHPLLHEARRAIVALPLTVHGRTFGAMGFLFDEERSFDDLDRTFLVALAEQCAHAYDRARAYTAEASARVVAEAENLAKDEFLSTLSHELRTPLTAILGWAHILNTRTVDAAVTARGLTIIERNAKTQARLVEDILDVGAIVRGTLRLALDLVDPAAIVRAAIDGARPAAETKGIVIDARIDDAIGMLVADPVRLLQIVGNLLSNAIKFTPKGGSVEVHLDGHGDEARLRIIDSGEGIAAGFLPHAFERFRQADASHTRSHGGLGIGLAIVKHLVELHEGSVAAASAGAGLGATFTVTLPLSHRTAAAPAEAEIIAAPPEATPPSAVRARELSREGEETCTK